MTKKIIEKPFPPVDEVCYSLPSPDVGVEIWNRLLDDDTSTLSLTFGAVHECESLHELINELNENHKSQYCYRGQIGQHFAVYSGHLPNVSEYLRAGSPPVYLDQFTVRVDSLIPSGFRRGIVPLITPFGQRALPGLSHILEPFHVITSNHAHPWCPLLGDYIRDAINGENVGVIMRTLAGFGANPGIGAGIEHEPRVLPKTLLRLISLAQHYEYESSMVDFTKDVDIAVWFATHRWSGDPVAEGRGVIYRVDLARANEAIDKHFGLDYAAIGPLLRVGIMGAVDISDIDPSYGLRPSRQHGISFFGLENSVVYLLMEMHNVAETFIFPIDDKSATAASVCKAELCPDEEMLLPTGDMCDSIGPAKALHQFCLEQGLSKNEAERVLLAYNYGLI